MLLSIYDLADIIGCSSSTLKNKYIKNDEAIRSLFATIRIKGSYKNTTYRKLVFDNKNIDTLKARIFDYECKLKLKKKNKKKLTNSIKDCMINDMDCTVCNSTNRIACDWFLDRNITPPIKRLAADIIDDYEE